MGHLQAVELNGKLTFYFLKGFNHSTIIYFSIVTGKILPLRSNVEGRYTKLSPSSVFPGIFRCKGVLRPPDLRSTNLWLTVLPYQALAPKHVLCDGFIPSSANKFRNSFWRPFLPCFVFDL